MVKLSQSSQVKSYRMLGYDLRNFGVNKVNNLTQHTNGAALLACLAAAMLAHSRPLCFPASFFLIYTFAYFPVVGWGTLVSCGHAMALKRYLFEDLMIMTQLPL